MENATLTATTSAPTSGTVSSTVHYRRRTRAVRKERRGLSQRDVETRRADTRTKYTTPSVATAGATAGNDSVTRRRQETWSTGEYSSIVSPVGEATSGSSIDNTIAVRDGRARPRSRTGGPAWTGSPDPTTVESSTDRPPSKSGRPHEVDLFYTVTNSKLNQQFEPASTSTSQQFETEHG